MNGTIFLLMLLAFAEAAYLKQDFGHKENWQAKWKMHKLTYNKIFTDKAHENRHKQAFLANLDIIREHNEAFARGEKTFQLGVNHLTDLPPSEYRKLNGYRHGNSVKTTMASEWLQPMNIALPDAVDWRKKGYVTPVKDQGTTCGSCWAFSSIGSLEGQHKRATGKLVSLSEQNLIDCSASYGNLGCDGGFMTDAFEYIGENHGVDTEKSYPYEHVEGECRFENGTLGSTAKGYVVLPSGDEDVLKAAIATQGPVSVAIDASPKSFWFYKSGVYFDPKCGNSSETLDHAVLAVGYGTDEKFGDYWIVKNSWAETWGDAGYILMARNKNNHCGIATRASYPLV